MFGRRKILGEESRIIVSSDTPSPLSSLSFHLPPTKQMISLYCTYTMVHTFVAMPSVYWYEVFCNVLWKWNMLLSYLLLLYTNTYLNHHSNSKLIVLEQMENVYYNDTLIMDITLLYLNYQDILIDCHGKLQLIHLWFNWNLSCLLVIWNLTIYLLEVSSITPLLKIGLDM